MGATWRYVCDACVSPLGLHASEVSLGGGVTWVSVWEGGWCDLA